MLNTYPGMTVEVGKIEKGSSRVLFDGVFAAGGITLSQISVMTGLEPYLIQNWVKRGFVTSPVKRLYSRKQFARIVIINMLKESLQIDKICTLIKIIGGNPNDESDDLISDDELYHRYVDMLAESEVNPLNAESVAEAALLAAAECEERIPNSKKQLMHIFEVMVYAHAAATLRKKADEIFSTLQ
ncbi:MAG: DUF1836 domain-containing protein [Ruminococcaceae bacterium]|nr:DUF1836 domain-containing protein [Oscillospiraceae bacterium]